MSAKFIFRATIIDCKLKPTADVPPDFQFKIAIFPVRLSFVKLLPQIQTIFFPKTFFNLSWIQIKFKVNKLKKVKERILFISNLLRLEVKQVKMFWGKRIIQVGGDLNGFQILSSKKFKPYSLFKAFDFFIACV